MFATLKEKLGPGLLYAAVAVGVSHLVQSTRAGATFGMIMVAYMVVVCLIKYPTFLFGARYTAATGETLVDGYERMGKWVIYLYFILQIFEYTFAISGVTVTTVGLVQTVIGTNVPEMPLAAIVLVATLIVLMIGKYALLEDLTRWLVILFTITTVIAAAVALTFVDTGDAPLSSSIQLTDTATLLFLVSVAGWMPTGAAGAIGISLWVKAKSDRLQRPVTVKEASFDFNVGYGCAIFTAACFVILGTVVMFAQGVPLEESSGGFATQLLSLFTSAIGNWVYPIIAVAAIAVMVSTLLTLTDLLPRTSAAVLIRLNQEKYSDHASRSRLYTTFIIVEFFLVMGVLFVLFDSFATFIDMVTALGFVVAPFIALLNHIVIFSSLVPEDKRPGPVLKIWSYVTIATLSVVCLGWAYLQYFVA